MRTLLSVRATRDNNVVTKLKGTYIQFRVREDVKEDLQTVAELRGLTMSALIHSMIVKTIREEKEQEPGAFKKRAKNGVDYGTVKLGTARKIKAG